MSRSRYFRASSFAALALATGLGATSAVAQVEDSTLDEVVVTGSLIAGTPEDAALPVNVLNFEDIKKLGAPNNVEIIRNISEIGMIQGESNRYSGLQQGTGSVNLRNIVSSRSIVIFNGRRLPDQVGGISQNTNMIPNTAIGRVEVLKEGGATTYGADAVGGVVNFITRKNYDGLEMTVGGRHIPGAEDTEYDASILWGKTFDRGNVMATLSYAHRSDVRALERDWSQREYLENNHIFAWTAAGSPGSYVPQARAGAAFVNAPLTNPLTQARSITGIVRDPFCSELGGFAGFSATPSPVCYWHLTEYDFLQEEQNTTQFYGEANYDLTDSFRLHAELTYSQVDLPAISISPGEGPARNPDGSTNSINPALFFSTPGTNPAVGQFLRDIGFYSPATIANITNPAAPGRVGLPLQAWRLFGAGGNPLNESGLDDTQHTTNESWRGTLSGNWDVGELFGNQLSLEGAITYQYTNYSVSTVDVLSTRLMAALQGFGGPGCNGIRADLPGSAGCYYFNPFSSAIPRNVATGAANPGFVGTGNYAGYAPGTGLQNNPDMLRWLYEPIWIEREQDFFVYDLILRGETKWELPGGPARWAVGGQYRLTENSRRLSDLANIGEVPIDPALAQTPRGPETNPCVIPGMQPGDPPRVLFGQTISCVTGVNAVGPFLVGPFGNRATSVLQGTTRFNETREYPVWSAFGEVNLPIFDNLQLNLSGRWEKFISDVTDNDNEVFVPAGSIRWQVNDMLALRATAGKTFSQVNPDVRSYTDATFNAMTTFGGNNPTATRLYENPDIKPETGFNYNLGVILNIDNFSATIDYYNITIDDYSGRDVTVSDLIAQSLQDPNNITPTNPLLNCASPFITEAQSSLDGATVLTLDGPCVAGTTRVRDIDRVTYTNDLNSGQLKTSGIDVTARIRFDDIWRGTLTLSTDLTYQLTYEVTPLEYLGIEIAEGWEGLGFLNDSPTGGKNGQHNSIWRASANVNYAIGRHNFNLNARFVDSLEDDRAANFQPSNTTNSNPADASSCLGSGANINSNPPDAGGTERPFNAACNVTILNGQKIEDFFTVDFTYRVELPWDTSAAITINNVFDQDPPFARYGLSYDPYLGSPLGRNIRFTITKRIW